ncbi:unnamed protein product [Pedinophyceae sp. YPF-701]|nr:unnamed protein product [Pedinophyceae sp. YPF-701]
MVSATERLERSYINRRFREEGLQCHRDAVEYLLGPARRAGGDGDAELEPIEEVVDRMLLLLDVRQLGGEAAVSREMLEGAVGALDATTASDEDLIVVPADQCPRIVYDQVRKAFHRDDAGEPRVLSASAGAKAALYRQRLLLVLQRLLRNRIFTRPDVDFGPSMAREHCELVPVQALLGTVGERQFALGCLSKLDDGGGVCLEDLTGAVPLALDGLKEDVAPGLYPENSIVVVEGELRHDGVFAVDAMVQPPAEAQVDSKAAAHGLDFFGGGHVSAEARARWDEGVWRWVGRPGGCAGGGVDGRPRDRRGAARGAARDGGESARGAGAHGGLRGQLFGGCGAGGVGGGDARSAGGDRADRRAGVQERRAEHEGDRDARAAGPRAGARPAAAPAAGAVAGGGTFALPPPRGADVEPVQDAAAREGDRRVPARPHAPHAAPQRHVPHRHGGEGGAGDTPGGGSLCLAESGALSPPPARGAADRVGDGPRAAAVPDAGRAPARGLGAGRDVRDPRGVCCGRSGVVHRARDVRRVLAAAAHGAAGGGAHGQGVAAAR